MTFLPKSANAKTAPKKSKGTLDLSQLDTTPDGQQPHFHPRKTK